MNHKRLVNALGKHVEIEVREQKWGQHTDRPYVNVKYIARNDKYIVIWSKKDDQAQCVYVHPISDRDEIETDYHCGWFAKNIKSVVERFKTEDVK